ncbi:MAG: TetR/AcrR family transcriptional regulator [Peptococcaceae bacterium]|nr:TetR/AcrR family transcriptional regulator [Peptococcaceae bacterium]
MEYKKTRKDKAANTKKKIFETAICLIKQKGYENVTISEICQNAGLAKGSFYVHYKSKEDIVRESYYADMGEYITTRYAAFFDSSANKGSIERIAFFLNLEFEFAEYAGYELTCLAYSLNLSACIPGPSEHFSKRKFTEPLYAEIEASRQQIVAGFSCSDVFDYFESLVRGVMATWCFSNQSFDISTEGKKYIERAIYSIYGEQ